MRIVYIGIWQVIPQLNLLRSGDREEKVEPKNVEVLELLASRPGEVFSKEEILQSVWSDVIVGESVLYHSISVLRQLFRDDPKNPAYIETVSKNGYRLIAPVKIQDEAVNPANGSLPASEAILQFGAPAATLQGAADRPARAVQRNHWLWVSITGTAVALLLWSAWFPQPEAMDSEVRTIAVLPFTTNDSDSLSDYLAQGLAESISGALCELSGVNVIPVRGLIELVEQGADLIAAASSQGADVILQGTLYRLEDTIIVHPGLIEGGSARLIWSEQYSFPHSQSLSAQREISLAVANALRPRLASDQIEILDQPATANPEAYDHYLRATYLHYYGRGRGLQDLQDAIRHYEDAVWLDPGYALAWGHLAAAQQLLAWDSDNTPDLWEEARLNFQRSFALDSSLPLSFYWKGWVHMVFEKDWTAAGAAFRRAKHLFPEYGSYEYFTYMLWMGRYQEARSELELLHSRYGPFSSRAPTWRGWHYYATRQFDRAIEQAHLGLERNSNQESTAEMLSLIEGATAASGRLQAACSAKWERLTLLNAGESSSLLPPESEFTSLCLTHGIEETTRLFEGKRSRRHPYQRALNAALQGNVEDAFDLMEDALLYPGLAALPSDPPFDILRADPRFEQVLRKTGLPEEAIERHLQPPPVN